MYIGRYHQPMRLHDHGMSVFECMSRVFMTFNLEFCFTGFYDINQQLHTCSKRDENCISSSWEKLADLGILSKKLNKIRKTKSHSPT